MKKLFLPLLLLAVLGSACKRHSLDAHPAWNTALLVPIAQGSLGLNNLLSDTLIQTNPDHSLNLVFKNRLYNYNINESLLHIPDTTIRADYKLDSLSLADRTLVYPISLGRICSQIGFFGTLIIAQNGNISVIPPITGVTSTDNPIDATQFFQTATLQTGYIDISLQNGLPIDVDTCIFQVRNQISNTTVTQDTFLHLYSGQTQVKTVDLSGQTVEGHMVAKILRMSSPGSNGQGVLIDTSDALVATMHAHNMKIDSATAVFPQQNIVDNNQTLLYKLTGGAQLKQVRIHSGQLVINMHSTIRDSTYFQYSLPGAFNASAQSISLTHVLPPAPVGGSSSASQTFDLSGYTLDLTGPNHNLYNTITNHLIGRIDSTGILTTIHLSDSVSLDYTLHNLVPEWAEGYMGQDIQAISGDADFPLFNKIKGGTLQLQSLSLDIGIENGVGVEGRIILDNLTSVNTRTNQWVGLSAGLLHSPLDIARATDNPLTPSYTTFPLNSGNSNIKSLVENLPDRFHYAGSVFINPHGNTAAWHDFVYYNSNLGVDLNLSMPLSLIASDLTLEDTLAFSLAQAQAGKPAITDGTFNLIAENGYPLQCNIQFYLYDDNFQWIDSLLAAPHTIAAATLDNSTCKVAASAKTVLQIPVDESKMQRLKRAAHAIAIVHFNTAQAPGCGGPLSIYSDYKLGLELTGKFNFYTGN